VKIIGKRGTGKPLSLFDRVTAFEIYCIKSIEITIEILKKRCIMSMWLYDDAKEMEEFQALRREVKRYEKEYLDLRVQLRDTEADLI
jgi:hypothetical protein